MAWKKGDTNWWAYDLDLPETVAQVDIVFTPSARAGMLLSRFPVWPVKGLTSAWSGDAIVVPKVGIRTQDISMMGKRPPGEEETREHLMDALPPDGETARQVAAGMSLGDIRKQLEAQAAGPDEASEAGFALGSVMLAQRRLDEAMATLVKSPGDAGLQERVQCQLRYICSLWLDGAGKNSLSDMFSLGRAYEEGHGVGQDFQQAKYWYRKAANAGHLESKARLAGMPPLLQNPDEARNKTFADYRKQAAEWHMTSSTGYQDWVKRYARESFQSLRVNGNAAELKLIVTQVGGEVVGQLDQEARLSETLQVFELFADGKCQSYYQSSMGTKGGGGNPCPPEKLARLNKLIATLPEDHGALPPANRRLLIQTGSQTAHHAHVYDRANAPPEIGELMRLLYIPIYVPS
ncbi:MAG: hypothetical protein CFE26_12945, partial [Verrucomicrobiales bacterium VVV1]